MMLKTVFILIISFFLWGDVASAHLLDYVNGSPITIHDGFDQPSSSYGPLWEDNEVEAGMVPHQSWDLEAFFWDGSTLYVVAGYDFDGGDYDDGRAAYDRRWSSGDIFLFGTQYDYVIDFNRRAVWFLRTSLYCGNFKASGPSR